MLKKQFRLKKRKSFNYIYKKGKHYGNDMLTLVFVFARMRDSKIKIGFSVSKKVGNSVVRHKVVRRMRDAVKPLLPMIKEHHSIIFVAKEGIDKFKPMEIQKSMEIILKRAGLV
ncbi:MAG: ribonuclease P protein component [Firmicutes bacterium]|nr:ribonuclease P protein component [Bacillota bacterium]